MTNADAVKTLAAAEAARLCGQALAFLAAGKKVFVKGKATVAPWSAEKRAEMKALQLGAFVPGGQVEQKIDAAFGSMPEADMADAVALYCAAGSAEVERLWVAA